MGFLADVLALSPTVGWMGREASGTVCADETGNGLDGTYFGAVLTQGEPSIIPGAPTDLCFKGDGTDVWVARNDEVAISAPGNNFTALVTVKPTDLVASRDIIGKVDEWQIWLLTTGQLQGHITPAWNSFTSSNDAAGKLVAGQADLIAIRQIHDGVTGKASLWLRGIKVGEINKNSNLSNSAGQLRMGGSSAGGNRSFKGHLQGFFFWHGVALTDTQLQDLYTAWAAVVVNDPPTDPGAFVSPILDEEYPNYTGVDIEVEWGVSTDPEGEPVTYELEYTDDDGAIWTPIVAGLVTLTYSWDIALLNAGTHRLRVRANDGAVVSDWVESDNFEIIVNSPPTTPASFTTYPSTLDRISFFLVWAASSDPEGDFVNYHLQLHDGVDWVDLQTVFPGTIYQFDPSLESAGTYKFRVKAFDPFDGESLWLEGVDFTITHQVPNVEETGIKLIYQNQFVVELEALPFVSDVVGDTFEGIEWEEWRENQSSPTTVVLSPAEDGRRKRFVYSSNPPSNVRNIERWFRCRYRSIDGTFGPFTPFLYVKNGMEYAPFSSGPTVIAKEETDLDAVYGHFEWPGFAWVFVPGNSGPSMQYPTGEEEDKYGALFIGNTVVQISPSNGWALAPGALFPSGFEFEFDVDIHLEEGVSRFMGICGIVNRPDPLLDVLQSVLGIYVERDTGIIWVSFYNTFTHPNPPICDVISSTVMVPTNLSVNSIDGFQNFKITHCLEGFGVGGDECRHSVGGEFSLINGGYPYSLIKLAPLDPPTLACEDATCGNGLTYQLPLRGILPSGDLDENLFIIVGRADSIPAGAATFVHDGLRGVMRKFIFKGFGRTLTYDFSDRPAPSEPILSLL